ncbi:hypothetical protein SK128_025651, partial [Halocaridina rubra]
VGAEGRLRMSERHGQGILEIQPESRIRLESGKANEKMNSFVTEGRIRQDIPSRVLTSPTEGQVRLGITSNVTVPTPESRMRSAEPSRMGGTNRYSPSLHDHITPSPVTVTPSQEVTDKGSTLENISSNLANVSISKLKTDNLTGEEKTCSNPFGDFETEQMGANPFEDEYDESKNPFAEDSPKRSSPDEKNSLVDSTDNPFAKDDYDSKLNPFGDD